MGICETNCMDIYVKQIACVYVKQIAWIYVKQIAWIYVKKIAWIYVKQIAWIYVKQISKPKHLRTKTQASLLLEHRQSQSVY